MNATPYWIGLKLDHWMWIWSKEYSEIAKFEWLSGQKMNYNKIDCGYLTVRSSEIGLSHSNCSQPFNFICECHGMMTNVP